LPGRADRSEIGYQLICTDELFHRWHDDEDRQARDELIERFLPLAHKLAQRYSGSREPYDDLVQVASLGLVKAVERFDPDRGFQFSSFAVPTILGELKRHFRDTSWALHVDRAAQERSQRIGEGRRQLQARLGRSPTVDELAEHLHCSQEEVLDGLQVAEAYETVSLDAPRPSADEDVDGRLDALGDEDERLGRIEAGATVFAAAQHLPERDRQILYLRFGEDLTQAEIAERIGISQMQVSRLLRRAVRQLQEMTSERPTARRAAS
jgi:RNA polymerase sigma-B factor